MSNFNNLLKNSWKRLQYCKDLLSLSLIRRRTVLETFQAFGGKDGPFISLFLDIIFNIEQGAVLYISS